MRWFWPAGVGRSDLLHGGPTFRLRCLAIETLTFKHLRAFVGYSMGGMQGFEWITDYLDCMDKAVPIAGTARQTSYDLLNWDRLRRLIEADPQHEFREAVDSCCVE